MGSLEANNETAPGVREVDWGSRPGRGRRENLNADTGLTQPQPSRWDVPEGERPLERPL